MFETCEWSSTRDLAPKSADAENPNWWEPLSFSTILLSWRKRVDYIVLGLPIDGNCAVPSRVCFHCHWLDFDDDSAWTRGMRFQSASKICTCWMTEVVLSVCWLVHGKLQHRIHLSSKQVWYKKSILRIEFETSWSYKLSVRPMNQIQPYLPRFSNRRR